MSILNKIFSNLKADSDRTAIIDSQNQFTYRDLHKNVCRLLTQIEQTPASLPIFIWDNNGFHSISTILAALAARRPFVPLPHKAPLGYIKHQLTHFASGLLLVGNALFREHMKNADEHGLDRFLIRNIETPTKGTPLTYRISQDPTPGYILFTSGSSGPAKAVGISQENIEAFLKGVYAQHSFSEDDRFLNYSRLTFDLSLFDILTCFSAGATLCVIDSDKDYINPIPFIHKNNINIALLVPSTVRLINSIYRSRECPDLALKKVFFCGEKLLQSDLEFLRPKTTNSCHFYNWYGPTEATIACFEFPLAPEFKGSIPIGKPFSEMQYQIDFKNEYSPRMVGELILTGPQISSFGYVSHDNPRFSTKNKIKSYRTGDLVESTSEGLFWFGRTDNQIKRNGIRIDLDETEELLTTLLEASVYLINIDSKIYACVCQSNRKIPSFEETITKNIPSHLHPDQIVSLPSIPLNERGKVDRIKLRDLIIHDRYSFQDDK